MSESYFCVFCDAIVLSLTHLRQHLSLHFTVDEFNELEMSSGELSQPVIAFIDGLVDYENQLNNGLNLMPKELPKERVQTLMIGCPACDPLLYCFDLIPKGMDPKVCYCGRVSPHLLLYECSQCSQYTHYECINTTESKCYDCLSKNFEISSLRCHSYEVQRQHCYQHLNYYPFVCQFKWTESEVNVFCGRKFFTYRSAEKHLRDDHNLVMNQNENSNEFVSDYFDLNPIKEIDNLINDRLNSKALINLDLNILSSVGLVSNNALVIRNTTEEQIHSRDSFENSYNRKQIKRKLFKDSDNFNDNSLSKPKGKRGRGRPPKTPRPFSPATTVSSIAVPEEQDIDSFNDSRDVFLEHNSYYLNWFSQTKPTKFPYFPQKDDDVYYLPYGHQLYRNEVLKRRIYGLANKHNAMKFWPYDRILAKVAKIDFEFKVHRKNGSVVRCIYITLKPYDKKYGHIIHVKYHDMEGVADFLILREHYESSVEKEWSVGEEFRSIVDDNYWFGVVIGFNNADYCLQTQFKKYQIRWHSNSNIELLSPWDLEPIDESVTFNRHSFVPITDDDRRLFFRSIPDEWPQFDEKRELRRVAKGLKIILKMDKTIEFPILSDITDSRYRDKILYPVDLKTFISRVENQYYRRHLAIKYDIKFMEANIRKLIKSVKRDPEYKFDECLAKRIKYHTKFVTALSLLFIDTHDCTDPNQLYHNIDDYLETHDVKCYSAKRVHLNKIKKHPNILPTPHKRLALKPQSFGDSRKTLKIFRALKNTRVTGNQRENTISEKKNSYKSVKHSSVNATYVPNRGTGDELILPNAAQNELQSQNSSFNSKNSCEGRLNYSSDVSISPNEYQLSNESDDDNTDIDPDFKTSNKNLI